MLLVDYGSRSPSFNLALEDALLSAASSAAGWFMLWQNHPSIIIGRHQVAEEEANLELARSLDVPYLRRISGGGAVYQDAGNLNYSFICSSSSLMDFRIGLEPVLRALRNLGVDANVAGRNDLEVDGLKIGGAAMARRGDFLLLHGCLLFDVDLARLGALLSPPRTKLMKRGVASVSSRVANIKELYPRATMADLKASLARECSRGQVAPPESAIKTARRLENIKYLSESWNKDRLAERSETKRASFPWGEIEWSWNWRRGKIADSRIMGDFFAKREIGELENALDGLSRDELAVFDFPGDPSEFFHESAATETTAFFREEASR